MTTALDPLGGVTMFHQFMVCFILISGCLVALLLTILPAPIFPDVLARTRIGPMRGGMPVERISVVEGHAISAACRDNQVWEGTYFLVPRPGSDNRFYITP